MQGYPNAPPQYPQQNYPGGYPQQNYPGGYPSHNYPGGGYPEPGYPQFSQSGGDNTQGGNYTQHSSVYPEAMPTAYNSPGGEDPSASFDFTERSVRLGFIRKVYSILSVQLLIFVAFVALFIFNQNIQRYFAVNYVYTIVALVAVLVLMIALACCESVRRNSPTNYICLFLFTIAFSFLVGISAATYNIQEVMLALGMTAAITIGLTLFAFQTKIDFTAWGGALFALMLVLLIGGIFAAIFPSKIGRIAIAGLGAVVMCLYIIYDTQLMMGGKHKYSLSPEEYVFASLNLYLDIVNLFLYILALIGGRD